jgi:acyl-CoA reductase-like NAD-dependent aldehyde dehydrogenase
MTFSVTAAAINSEPGLNKLDELLKRIEEDVHQMEILDADLLEETSWYQTSRPERRLLLMKIATAMLYRSPRLNGLASVESGKPRLRCGGRHPCQEMDFGLGPAHERRDPPEPPYLR